MIEIIGSELNQWDDKRVIKVTNSVATHVHFANQGDSVAVVMELADSQALIPNYLLCTGKQLCVYAVKDGVTIERKTFSVRKRERPEEYVYDGDQRNYIYELITDAQTATEAANQSAKNASEAAEKANQAAKSWVIVGEVKGESVVIDDAIDQTFAGFRIFGKTTQDGVPTPEAPVDLVSVENPTIAVNEQSMVVPYTLRGIPVSSGGNYTDANGQQWICDEVDFARGVYIKRIDRIIYDGSSDEHWAKYGTEDNISFNVWPAKATQGTRLSLCDRFANTPTAWESKYATTYGIYADHHAAVGKYFRAPDETVKTLEQWNAWLAENPTTLIYVMATPIETPLPEEDLSAFATLQTTRGSTTVSNDAGAYMEIQYVMDAKKYIDSVIGTGGASAGIVNATVE